MRSFAVRTGAALALLLLALLAPPSADAQPLALQNVAPFLPGKNQVRWWEFDWRSTEFRPTEDGAPVQLFFYESERSIAQLAIPPITDAYREYTRAFGFQPDLGVPFLLYNSHFEFESTNAFFISEGVLGVTNVEDLTVALPFWGEFGRFEHVMRHELAHHFTLQKLRAVGRSQELCNPVQLMPLWFIEGLAEHLSLGALTPEVRAALADRLGDPAGDLPDYFAEGPYSFERIYLFGHAQVRMLDEVFGEGSVLRVLEESSALCAAYDSAAVAAAGGGEEPVGAFPTYLATLFGTSPGGLRARWVEWAAREVGPLPGDPLEPLQLFDGLGAGQLDSFSLAPDGRTLFYRTVDRDTGVARLYLRDLEDPDSRELVTQDQRLGLSSLHPTGRRVTAIGPDTLAYVGRRGATDCLFVRRYTREVRNGRVRLRVAREVRHPLGDEFSLIEGGWPALDPRSGALAFVGLSRETGFLDVYRIDEPLDPDARLVRVTQDHYAEQGLAFDEQGELLYGSDATADARFEIVRRTPGRVTVLTAIPGALDALSPTPAGAGRVLFEAGESGTPQICLAEGGRLSRLTTIATSLESPSLDAEGNLVALALVRGERRLVRLQKARLVAIPAGASPAEPPVPFELRLAEIGEVREYAPLSPENLDLLGVTGFISGGPLIVGNLLFADRFKSHLLGLNVQMLGSLDFTDAELFYFDRSGRWTRGISLFVDTGEQVGFNDGTVVGFYLLQSLGLSLFAEYPFGRYTRVQASVSPMAIRAFDYPGELHLAPGRRGFYPSMRLGVGLAIDTTRLTLVGPASGWALGLQASATAVSGAESFVSTSGELQAAQPFVRGRDRLYLHERLAAGANFGGPFAEQFYLPAAYNLRALPEGSLQLLGNYYWLGQFGLHFPLAPALGELIFLQGVVGLDVGAISASPGSLFDHRVAALVLGTNVGLGTMIIRLNWARPFAIGPQPPFRRWLFHLSLVTPFGAFL